MLNAEDCFMDGKKKQALACAQDVLKIPGADVYYPAARQMIQRCGVQARKAGKRTKEVFCEA